MDPTSTRVELPGSQRLPAPGARRLGTADPSAAAEVTVLLRRPSRSPPPPFLDTWRRVRADRPPFLSRTEFAARHGADDDDVDALRAFARAYDLRISRVDGSARAVRVAGTVGDLARAFGTTMHRYVGPHGSYRGREGPLLIPSELRGIVLAVLGLDDRPQARPHVRPRPTRAAAAPS